MRLRPGNAGANTVVDQLGVLDAAIDGLPADIAAGHHVGDDPALVRRPVQVRGDSTAGRTFALACRARNVSFAVVARSNERIHAAISRVAYDSTAWQPAIRQNGDPRQGAAVVEVTGLVDLSDWPAGTRLILATVE